MSLNETIVKIIRQQFPVKDGEFLPLHAPIFAGREKEYVLDCIETTFVSSVGAYVDRFEDMVREITGTKHAIAIVNGTCALHLGLTLLGAGPDCEVITQPLTFVATANAIAHTGAHPVFVDVAEDTLGMCPDSLERFLDAHIEEKGGGPVNKETGRKISACVPMHSFGHPCAIERIVEICARYHIPVLEDAAEALGSRYKSQHLGTFGDIGVLSFNGNKIVTAGGGGAIITNDDALGHRAKHLSTTAKTLHSYEYIHDETGYNYRLTNLSAALACAQLEQLDEFLANKRKLATNYAEGFANLNGVEFITEPKDANSNYWLNTLKFETPQARTEFLEQAASAHIQARAVWKLMSDLPMYSICQKAPIPVSEIAYQHLVNIPSSANAK